MYSQDNDSDKTYKEVKEYCADFDLICGREKNNHFPIIKNPIDTDNNLKYIFQHLVPMVAARYPEILTDNIKRTLPKILKCRTESLGGILYGCTEHKFAHLTPFSCSCRFCPVCSNARTQKWLERSIDLLTSVDTPYFFLTFTIPSNLSQLIKYNKALLEDYFQAVSHTLLSWSKKRGFIPGIVSVMQTSGDRLNYHVHIHLLITAGGLCVEDFNSWMKCHHFNRKALVRTFKTLIFRALRRAFKSGQFVSPPEYADNICSGLKRFNRFLDKLFKLDWNLDIQANLKKAGDIIGYIARYIKKAPISNRRIIEFNEHFITALFRDYGNNKRKGGEKIKKQQKSFKRIPQTISMDHFVKSLLQHLPEKGFRLIRWYGIFSNRSQGKLLKKCPKRELKGEEEPKEKDNRPPWRIRYEKLHGHDPLVCPVCGKKMVVLMILTKKKIRKFNDLFCTFQDVIAYFGYQTYALN